MFKLIRYEFRKSLVPILVLLGIAVTLEAYFLIALSLESQGHIAASIVLLYIYSMAALVFVYVRGIISYSGELRSRYGYLVFMTPNSELKIMGSKFLYTFLHGLIFAALLLVLATADITMLFAKFGEYSTFFTGIKAMLSTYGVFLDNFLYAALFFLGMIFLQVLSTVATAYLAITLSHTLLHGKRVRWLVAIAFFAAITALTTWINSRFPSPMDSLVLVDMDATGSEAVQQASSAIHNVIIPSLLPSAGLSLAVVIGSLFGCAGLLKHKVSL